MIDTLIARFLFWLSARLRCRKIDINDAPYMERYFLFKAFGVTFCLHRWLAPDGERELHDHPWRWARSIVLSGGYWEDRLDGLDPKYGVLKSRKAIRRWRTNRLTPTDFHSVVSLKPNTWTLFWYGQRFKGWGFLKTTAIPTLDECGRYKEVTVYHQHLDSAAFAGWTKTAPRGRDVERTAVVEA